MNVKRIAIPIMTVMIVLAMFTTTVMAADCDWPDCGSKVEQCAPDAVYALTLQPAAQFGYFDYNMPNGIAGVFDDSDTGYIDMDGNGVVSTGDVRITAWHNVPSGADRKYEPNTKVLNDDDLGLPLVVPADQTVMCCVDLQVNGYDITDPVYVDVDNDGAVSTHDIRLTDNPWGYAAYTTVGPFDDDRGEVYTLIGNGIPSTLLGFIDSDCSGSWTCPDKLYLQQPGPGPHDGLVTIGDLRLYIPSAMVGPGPEEPCWENCSTKVEQGDVDAVYALMRVPTAVQPLAGRLGYHNYGGGAPFDDSDTMYVDMDGNGVVSTGDVRITAWHNAPPGHPDRKYEPNTKVFNDEDLNIQLQFPNQNGLIKYFDINGMYGYDLGDPLYVDVDGNSVVSLYDIRLVPTAKCGAAVCAAYTTVASGDLDLIEARALLNVGTGRPADLIGYIDSDCSRTWTCPDKLYLEQPPLDQLVTIGDMRLYIPPDAIAHGWPECGTKVVQCDNDTVYRLKIVRPQLAFFDYNIPGGAINVFDDSDTMYLDMDRDGTVTPGDIRITAWHNVPPGDPDRKYEPNTKVFNDEDLNLPLVVLPQGGLIKYFDINGMYGYDLGDPLYVDVDGNSVVSLYDIRLVPTAGCAAYTTVAPGDLDLLEARALLSVGNGRVRDLIGYIDDDCTNGWTCPDKLYLQQIDFVARNWGFEQNNLNNWIVVSGNVDVLRANDFTPAITPPHRNRFALLSTGPGDTTGGAVGPDDRDGALGNENDPAVLQRNFNTPVPSKLSFSLDFLTSEENQAATFDDIFEVRLDNVPIVQGSVMQLVGPSSPFTDRGPCDGVVYTVVGGAATTNSVFDEGRTGFTTYTVPITAGAHTIEFYLGDQGNHIVDSGLLIDAELSLVTIGDDRIYMPLDDVLELMEGDVSLNKHVDITDALMIAQNEVGLIVLNADQLKCADTTDMDGVTITDAMHIAQWIVDPTGALGVLAKPLWESPADDDMLPPLP